LAKLETCFVCIPARTTAQYKNQKEPSKDNVVLSQLFTTKQYVCNSAKPNRVDLFEQGRVETAEVFVGGHFSASRESGPLIPFRQSCISSKYCFQTNVHCISRTLPEWLVVFEAFRQ
jgi:hypothetical protein